MKLLYCYIAFAYGYGLSLMGEIQDDLICEYGHNKKEYRKALFANILVFILFPIIWPCIIVYGWVQQLLDIIKG